MALVQSRSPTVAASRCGMQYDLSPQRKQEGVAKIETHDVCLVDDTPLSLEQLQSQVTPEKKHLMILPKQGRGSKMALYANYQTGPLLVVADLLDTLLQRLTHRIQVLIWQHCQSFGTKGGYDLEALVKKIMSLSVTKKSAAGDIQHLTYVTLVQIVSNELCEDDAAPANCEDDQDDESVDDEEALEDVEDDQGTSLKQLIPQIEEAKEYVQDGKNVDSINHHWLECLLQVAECGLLMSSLESPSDSTCFSTSSLRVQLMLFVTSTTKSDRNKAAHLFGSLLSRDFLAETLHAKYVQEDDGANSGETPFFLPWERSDTLTMEQPLFGPKALNCNFSNLEDREEILDDICSDQERSLRSFQEDVSRASELLIVAVKFWRKGVFVLREKRQSRMKKKTMSKKKARHQ